MASDRRIHFSTSYKPSFRAKDCTCFAAELRWTPNYTPKPPMNPNRKKSKRQRLKLPPRVLATNSGVTTNSVQSPRAHFAAPILRPAVQTFLEEGVSAAARFLGAIKGEVGAAQQRLALAAVLTDEHAVVQHPDRQRAVLQIRLGGVCGVHGTEVLLVHRDDLVGQLVAHVVDLGLRQGEVVDVDRQELDPGALDQPWEQVRPSVRTEVEDAWEATDFTFPSPYVEIPSPMRAYAEVSFPAGRPIGAKPGRLVRPLISGSGLNLSDDDAAVFVSASDASTPTTSPIPTSTSASHSTSHSTPRPCAPSAMRMPISFVRRATPYDITP